MSVHLCSDIVDVWACVLFYVCVCICVCAFVCVLLNEGACVWVRERVHPTMRANTGRTKNDSSMIFFQCNHRLSCYR